MSSPRFRFSQKHWQWEVSLWLLTLSLTAAVPLGVHCPVLHTHCRGPCSPRLGWLLSLPGPAAHLLQGCLLRGRILQQKWGAAGREQSRAFTPVPGLQMSPMGTGGWKPKHREREFYKEGKKQRN